VQRDIQLDSSPETWEWIGRYAGAGLALGLGGIGAAIGMGMSAGKANEGIMRQPQVHGQMLRTMLIGQAVGSSPSVFALIIGLMILFVGGDAEGAGNIRVAAFIGAGLAIGLGAFGSGLGCGYPGAAACEGVARNPKRGTPVTQAMIIGQAVAQSPSIFALVIALMMLFMFAQPGNNLTMVGALVGSGLAMGAGALGSGIGSGKTAGGGVEGSGHWPKAHGLTIRTMLIGQAVCETPAIFGMLIAIIMMFTLKGLNADMVGFAKTLGAGIAAGFGGIGPGIGSGLAGGSGCAATAANPDKEPVILRTMLMGQAVSQSTAIYALIIALLLLMVVR
jgi:F0F1-type ATP synthase membrane subunit c/vacuolar-type H+-ATPase subunit K